jgi:uncharacterized membrane protein
VSDPAQHPINHTRRRRLGWALIASLAFNLFFIGLIGATAWRWHDRREMAMGFAGAGWMMPMLPDELRGQLRERMQQRRLDLRERWLEVRQARLAVVRTLAAEPYDRAAADRAFAELRQRIGRVQEVMHGAIAEAAADLTPEQRKALVDRLPPNP